jgi:undecaprenyl-diphosphatase
MARAQVGTGRPNKHGAALQLPAAAERLRAGFRLARAALTSLVRERRRDALLLVAALAVVACVLAFFEVAEAISAEHTQELDRRVIQLLRRPGSPSEPIGPPWLKSAVRDFSALGSPALLALFSTAVAVALLVRRQFHALFLMLAATLGGRLMNVFLKAFFERPRPDAAFHLTEVASPSFPSGHAMDSAVIYLTLAAVLSRLVRPRALKLYFVGGAMLMSFLAGASRVYLGVHYPSDVLAGWTAGLGWAVLCWSVASYLQRRGSVEAPK